MIIGGSMETGSYLLAGLAERRAELFHHRPRQRPNHGTRPGQEAVPGDRICRSGCRSGASTSAASSYSGLAEEAGAAYKDIDEVVRSTAAAGLSRPGSQARSGGKSQRVDGLYAVPLSGRVDRGRCGLRGPRPDRPATGRSRLEGNGGPGHLNDPHLSLLPFVAEHDRIQ